MTDYYSDNNGNVARLMIIGVGGGGGNAVDSMIKAGIRNVEFVAMNTDKQALSKISAKKFVIGEKLTKGLGAGANPEIGKGAAEESVEGIKQLLNGVDLLFIAAGMGGGTGTGAAPVVARVAKELGILTIAVVTKPFNFEGLRRMKNAEMGIEALKGNVDSLVIVQNEKLNNDKNFSIIDAFEKADEILLQGIRGIADIIVQNGKINLDLADVKTVMANSGMAHMGIGVGRGEDKVIAAIKSAVYSPLLETTIQGASSIIVNFRGGQSMLLSEIRTGVDLVRQVISKSANVLFGVCIDESLKEEVQVTLIATGFVSNPTNESSSFFADSNRATSNEFSTYAPQPAATVAGTAPTVTSTTSSNIATRATTNGSGQANRQSIPVEEDKDIPPFLRKLKQ